MTEPEGGITAQAGLTAVASVEVTPGAECGACGRVGCEIVHTTTEEPE